MPRADAMDAYVTDDSNAWHVYITTSSQQGMHIYLTSDSSATHVYITSDPSHATLVYVVNPEALPKPPDRLERPSNNVDSDNHTADYWVTEGRLAAQPRDFPDEGPPDYSYALESYNRALAIDPGHGGAHLGWGIVYYRLKQYQRALDELDRSITGPEAEWLDQVYRARCYLALGKHREAFEVSNKLITTFEERARERRKFFKEHPELFEVNNPSYYLLRARAYAGLKDYTRADADFSQAHILGGDSSVRLACHYYEGNVYLERGNYQKARDAFDYVLDSSSYKPIWDREIDDDTLRSNRDEAHRRLLEEGETSSDPEVEDTPEDKPQKQWWQKVKFWK